MGPHTLSYYSCQWIHEHKGWVVQWRQWNDEIKEVRSLHVGLTWLALASYSSADNLQAGDDRVQVHTRSRTIIPGWRLRTGPICCWQATHAVCQRKDTGASSDKTAISTREIAVSAAVVWNSLPLELRILSCSVQTFAQRLKKHLFISCYERIWGFSISRYTNVLVIIIINSLVPKVNDGQRQHWQHNVQQVQTNFNLGE